MQQMQGRICGDSIQAAQACSKACHQQLAKQGYTVPGSSSKHLTPPPSQPGSPRRSLEMTAPTSPLYSETQRSYVAPALNRAFSSSDEDEHDDILEADGPEAPSLFPTSMYRTRTDSKRSPTQLRPGSLPSPARDTIRHAAGATARNLTPPNEQQDFHNKSRSMTPEMRVPAIAPMSAAFARLSHKDTPEPVQRGRKMTASSDLGAKMFEGAA